MTDGQQRDTLPTLLLVLAAALCGLTAPPLRAQVFETGALPQYNAGKYKWESLRSDHFEVWYYDNHQALATHALHYAEAAFEDLGPLLEHMPQYPVQLHVYPSPFTYQSYAERRTFYDKRNLHINVGAVYYPGSQREFNRVIRTEVAEIMLEDMFFGAGFQGGVQNRLLLGVPPWYNDGLGLLLGEGWLPHDEALMRSLMDTDYLTPILNEATLYSTPTVQKSLWRFVAETYGTKRLSEIIYMTRLTRSAENAFISVLGLTLPALTQKWLGYLRDTYKPNPATHWPADTAAQHLDAIKRKPGSTICGSALAPDGSQLAVALHHNGTYHVVLYNPKTQTTTQTGIHSRAPHTQTLVRPPHVPLAWSPDGTRLLAALPRAKRMALHLYEPKKANSLSLKLKDDIDMITALSWAPTGERVAMSMAIDGQTDLYIYQADKKTLLRLTNDLADDLDPAWSPDGKTLYFASNRDTLLKPVNPKPNYRWAGNSLDLYALNPPAPPPPLRRITATPHEDETRPWMAAADTTRLYYTSTVTGCANLRALSLLHNTAQGGRFLTDYPTGVWQPTATKTAARWLLPTYHNGLPALYLRTNPDRNQDLYPQLVPLAAQMLQAYKQHYAAGLPQQPVLVQVGGDTAKTTPPGGYKPGQPGGQPIDTSQYNNNIANPATPQDTAKTKGPKFYVFDEDDQTPKPPKKKNQPALQTPSPQTQAQAALPPFDINKIKIVGGDRKRFTLNLRQTEIGLRIDPIYRLGIYGRVYMEDPFRYHQLYGHLGFYTDMRSNDVRIGYLNRQYPVHFGLEAYRAGRYLDVGQPFTYTTFGLEATLRYPISRYASIGLHPSYLDITRRDLRLTDFTNLDGRTQLAGLRLRFLYDNVKSKANFPLSGLRAEFNLGTNYSLQNQDLRYGSATVDVRYYQPLLRNLVLALRISGGMGLGDKAPTYFLGGLDNWINAEFTNRDDLPIRSNDIEALHFSQMALPLRGFGYNARKGTRYGMANAELRVPLLKLFNSSLTASPLYNLQWVLYYDIGTAWTTGNPFSQQNPIDVTTIFQPPLTITVQSLKGPFVQGFGTGVRALLLGYFVRLDVAWGIEDSAVSKKQFSVSLGTEF